MADTTQIQSNNVDPNTNASTDVQATGNNTAPAVTTTPETTPASTTPSPATKKGGSVMMPSSALKDIKAKAAERGKREALAALDDEARKLGFENHEALKLAAAKAKMGASAKPNQNQNGKPNQGKPNGNGKAQSTPNEEPTDTETQPKGNDRNAPKLQRENQQLLEDKRRLNKRKNALEKQLAEQNAAIQREQVLRQLSRMATRAGIVGDDENDLAIALYEKHVASLSDDALETFDDEKFFAEHLKQSKPYLYGVREVPANTSPTQSASASPTPTNTPSPSPSSTQSQGNSRVDATKMSKQEWQAYLASRSLSNPS